MSLDEGAAELLAGMQRFSDEGISKITKLLNEDLGSLADQLKKISAAGRSYTTFAGAAEGTDSSVRFIYRTDSIE